jgi:uncharacterized membrane protein
MMIEKIQTGGASNAVRPENRRLAYIDWMRGFACLAMFQGHCYDAWLGPWARGGRFYRYSQLIDTMPAPIFLFLCGVSFALVTERLRQKGVDRDVIARQTMLRGAAIYGAGFLFRLQEFVLGYPKAPWSDLLRVDVLNILGLAMMLMGAVCWVSSLTGNPIVARLVTMVTSVPLAAGIALATPLVWTSYRPQFLPWPIESYIDGVHTYGAPQPWVFPIFPWVGFAFLGLAVGFFLLSDFAAQSGTRALAVLGVLGVGASVFSLFLDRLPFHLYANYDYWHSNPLFFLMRCGLLLLLLFAAFAWCHWGWARKGFSPAIQLGQTSLLVYWAHVEFVYGRLSIVPKERSSIAAASLGLLVILAAMLALSVLRTSWKQRHPSKSFSSETLSVQNVPDAV